LIAPTGLRAGLNRQDDRHQDDRRRENEHQKRYYDREYKDYHNWDDREASAYRNWRQERNENRDFSKLKRKEQSEYWKWRHEHPDNDRDRHQFAKPKRRSCLVFGTNNEFCFETRTNRLDSCRKYPTAVTQAASECPLEVTDAFF
jgi:hypothetical protein